MRVTANTQPTSILKSLLVLGLFLGLLVVGCQSDSPTAPDEALQDPGQISVAPEPGEIDAPWFLIRPDKLVHRGNGAGTLEDLPPGQYQLGWGAVPGWQSPTPNPQRQVLGSGAQITFGATYREIQVETGSIAVDTTPDEINAPWNLAGPNGFYVEGAGDEVLNGREPGTYTITWQPVADYDEQSPSQAVLEAGGRIDFGGSYVFQASPGAGTIIVDVNPDFINAPWLLEGPDGYSRQGNGDDSIGDLEAGDYRLIFAPIQGWHSPQPGVVNEALVSEELAVLVGNYTENTGPGQGRPAINQVNGVFSRDGQVVISGSDFGVQDVEVESSLGTDGWIESNTSGTRVNAMQGASDWDSFSAQFPAYVDNSRAHSGSNSINASVDQSRDGDWNKIMYYTRLQKFDKIYATWWVYFDPIRHSDYTQWKMWRVGDDGGNFIGSDNCASLYQTSGWSSTREPLAYSTIFHCMQGCQWPMQKQCYHNILPEPYYPPVDGDPYYYQQHSRGGSEAFKNYLPRTGVWSRAEFFLDSSDLDTPNGKYWLTINRPGETRRVIDNWVDGLITHRSDCCQDETNEWSNFVLQGYFDDNGGGFQGEKVDLFYDDIYLQFGTAARIELGDNREFEFCTQLEVQETGTWQDDEIRIKLNHGAFSPGSSLFLFVVGNDGQVSDGYPVTIE